MPLMKRPAFAWSIAALAIVVIAFGGVLTAQTVSRLRAFDGGPPAEMTDNLPPVTRGPMTITPGTLRGTSILSFDDSSCESGLGAGTTAFVTDLVQWDVPTQCNQAGLEVVGVTTRMNTGQPITRFAWAQSGATVTIPDVSTLGISAINPIGPCSTAGSPTITSRVVPAGAVISGTSNFFAGVRAQGFVGRDTDGIPAGRIWLLCATCGMTQYTPTTLTGIGLGGNWFIRVTVEDQNCIPVELMEITVEDS